MSDVSVTLPRCGLSLARVVSGSVLSGAKPLCSMAMTWVVECVACDGCDSTCASAVPGKFRPLDMVLPVLKKLPKHRLRDELPLLVSRLGAASLWSALAALARAKPLTTAPVVVELFPDGLPVSDMARSGDWAALRDFALAGVLPQVPDDCLYRFVPHSARELNTKKWLLDYCAWLDGNTPTGTVHVVLATVVRELQGCGLPVEIIDRIARFAMIKR